MAGASRRPSTPHTTQNDTGPLFATRSAAMPRSPITYSPGRPSHPEFVDVIKTEEKRSDVNIATLLLADCFEDDFEQAVVISNDSDLTLPIETVTVKFGRPVGMVNPHPGRSISQELIRVTTFHVRTINKKLLADSQFPATLTDSAGSFTRPSRWR